VLSHENFQRMAAYGHGGSNSQIHSVCSVCSAYLKRALSQIHNHNHLKWGLYSLFDRFHRHIFGMLLINDLENREYMKCYTKDLKNMNARSQTPAENLKKKLAFINSLYLPTLKVCK
jgi:hypothetical protein